jgi:hypothetical protein
MRTSSEPLRIWLANETKRWGKRYLSWPGKGYARRSGVNPAGEAYPSCPPDQEPSP